MPQKSFFFAFLVFFHIDTTYIKLDWNSENFLIFWCTLRDMLSLLSDTHHAGPTLDGGNWGLDCTDDY